MKPIKVIVSQFDDKFLDDADFYQLGRLYYEHDWKVTKPNAITVFGRLLVVYNWHRLFPERPVPKFILGLDGKPFFSDFPDFQFNISDTKKTVVAAFDDDEIGIDVEHLRKFKPDLVQRFFSEKEREFVERNSMDEARNEAFSRLWSLKESVVKCLGTGIAKDFTNYTVDVDEEQVQPVSSGMEIAQATLPDDIFISLCTKGHKPMFDIETVGMSEIMDVLKKDVL